MEYKFELTHDKLGLKHAVWSLKGPHGGVHIWAQFMAPDNAFGDKCYGGIEVHYPKSPYDHSPDKPHHEKCWLLDGPCWHDGSSLYFSERLADWIADYEDELDKVTDGINRELLSWYKSHLSKEPDIEPEFM